MTAAILQEILENKRKEIERSKRSRPREELERRIEEAPPVRDFRLSLAAKGFSCIAEMKRATPARGALCQSYDPGSIAREYEAGGASALSVLTDQRFFQGSWEHLVEARSNVSLPVLRKDFILDEYQILESRVIGADAVLLIAGILDQDRLIGLARACKSLGMACIAECHSREDICKSLEVGAEVIGINNRNIRDFSTDINVSLALRPLVPNGLTVVSESGIRTRDEIVQLEEAGFDAVLIGETLMGARDRSAVLRSLFTKA